MRAEATRAAGLRGLAAALLLASGGAALADAGDYFRAVDLDGDGRLSLAEFLERMSYAFHQRDADGDGVLAPHEQHAPGARAITLDEHRARFATQFLRQDADGDGYLSPAEFLAPPR